MPKSFMNRDPSGVAPEATCAGRRSFHVHGMPVETIKLTKVKAAELGITMAELVQRTVTAFMGGR